MTRKVIVALLLLSAGALQARAKPDREYGAAMAAVDAFFAAINGNDGNALARLYTPEATIVARRKQPDGNWIVRTRTGASDVENARKETRRFTETYWKPTLTIHQGIAVFWAPYSFDIDGKRSHCGVDVVNLVKVDGVWRISAVGYTVEPDGCPRGR